MKTRLLPPEEWTRVTGAGIPFVPELRPENRAVIVVESEGVIVAAMTVFRATHYEGLWIDPEHRNGGIGRALMREAAKVATERWEDSWVFADVVDDEMASMAIRAGGSELPVSTFVMPIGER